MAVQEPAGGVSSGKVLVLGSTGNIGRPLVSELLRARIPVRAAVHREPQRSRQFELLEEVRVDLSDPSTFGSALEGVDRVFLLTPANESAPRMVENFMNAAKAVGSVKKVVRLSAYGAQLEEGKKCRLLRSHFFSEDAIRNSGIPWTILRPMGFFQNYSNYYAESIRDEGLFFLPLGEAKSSSVDTRDVASVACRVLLEDRHQGKEYSITGPEALTCGRIAEVLSEVLGREVRYISVSDDEMRQGMLAMGAPEWLIEGMVELMHFWRTGLAEEVTSVVREITGRDPIAFSKFAEDYTDVWGGTLTRLQSA